MTGEGEFRGAILSGKEVERYAIPRNEPADLMTSLKYVERANSICSDLGKRGYFKAVMTFGRVYVKGDLVEIPCSFNWKLFASCLSNLEVLWNEWYTKTKGVSPNRTQLLRTRSFLTAVSKVSKCQLSTPGSLKLEAYDLWTCIKGLFYVTIDTSKEGKVGIEICNFQSFSEECTVADKWVTFELRREGKQSLEYKTEVAESWNHFELLDVDDIENDLIFEIWEAADLNSNIVKRDLGKNPLSLRPAESNSIIKNQKSRCVVCLRSGRKGEVRKSGYKCTQCIGVPSQRNQPQVALVTRSISQHVIGDANIAKGLCTASAPGYVN